MIPTTYGQAPEPYELTEEGQRLYDELAEVYLQPQVYECPSCGIVRRLRDLISGCPQCGQTMIPHELDPTALWR